jgi:DNA-directed RNA polymerase subunit beta
VGEEALQDLDESGIVKVGAEVKPGDILAGKITPKGETQLSPEEKLLRAIFGDKAGDVKDTSLRVPPGVEGIAIDAKVFSRRGVERDPRSLRIQEGEKARLEKDKQDEIQIIAGSARKKLKDILVDQKLKSNLRDKISGKVICSTRRTISAEDVDQIPIEAWLSADLKAPMDLIEQMEAVVDTYARRAANVEKQLDEKIERLSLGDELAPGVIKMVKVYIAVKRKLSVGDKMAGRHGNKGVLSRILPVEDMPYFADGTPVDIVLNPLGVPSRMNVGQVLETHLGWASHELGKQVGAMLDQVRAQAKKTDALRKKLRETFTKSEYNHHFKELNNEELLRGANSLRDGVHMASPVFDGAREDEIKACLEGAGLPVSGQATLYDGRTGVPFDRQVTVGIMYMMKLHHLVDDKLHARSIGPYSLVTQQPLGGKAQFGGQRLGEMEVWAMEAYGAAYSLQEFLTVKSDDVAGRTRMYERIVKGNNILEAGLPESFKVLIKELQSLGLEAQLFEDSHA